MHLHRGVLQLPIAMSLYKDMSYNASSHTLPLHLYVTHALSSSTCLFTRSPHGTIIQFATVASKQNMSSLSCQAHIEGGVGFVLTVPQMMM
jgi:hypothetical protein